MSYQTRQTLAEKINEIDHQLLDKMNTPERRSAYMTFRKQILAFPMKRRYNAFKRLRTTIANIDSLYNTLTPEDMTSSEGIELESDLHKKIARQDHYEGKRRTTWTPEMRYENGHSEKNSGLPDGIQMRTNFEIPLEKVKVSLSELLCKYGKTTKKK